MRVTVDIPDNLEKYLEYIPNEDLPDVLVEALKAKIFGEVKQVEQENQVSLEALMSLLERGIANGQMTQAVANESSSIEVKKAEVTESEEHEHELIIKKVEAVKSDTDDDGLDDFMDLMK